MSQPLISRSPDLKRLRDEGYHVVVSSGYLLIKDVPYLDTDRQIKQGVLVSELTLKGNVTDTPSTHVAYFAGDYPCDKNGAPLDRIRHQSEPKQLFEGCTVNHSFSSKPPEGYKDYHHKMTAYVRIIAHQAAAVDPTSTARTFPVITSEDPESVYEYEDTASSRADIVAVTEKLSLNKVAIIGIGGTGSYVLDLVAKTPVREIHLFDGDKFSQHNAFRSPGAPSVDELSKATTKAEYFRNLYSKMHRNIFAHACYVDESTIEQLEGMDFVFLCLDRGNVKKLVVEKLESMGTGFIDVGMGITLTDQSLGGILRVTTSTPSNRSHVHVNGRIPFAAGNGDDDYGRNIQIADLNALNAALAVVKWKKLYGFYRDLEKEHFSTYTTDGNALYNEEQA